MTMITSRRAAIQNVVAVQVPGRTALAEVGGEEVFLQPEDEPHEQQPDVPDAEHDGGPDVGADLDRLTGERLNGSNGMRGRHLPGCAQVRQPAAERQVGVRPRRRRERGRFARGDQPAGHRPTACVRSSRTPIRASTSMTARTSDNTHATTQSGPSVAFTCAATGVTDHRGAGILDRTHPRRRQERPHVAHQRPPLHRRRLRHRPRRVDLVGPPDTHLGQHGHLDLRQLPDRTLRGAREPDGDPRRPDHRRRRASRSPGPVWRPGCRATRRPGSPAPCRRQPTRRAVASSPRRSMDLRCERWFRRESAVG